MGRGCGLQNVPDLFRVMAQGNSLVEEAFCIPFLRLVPDPVNISALWDEDISENSILRDPHITLIVNMCQAHSKH